MYAIAHLLNKKIRKNRQDAQISRIRGKITGGRQFIFPSSAKDIYKNFTPMSTKKSSLFQKNLDIRGRINYNGGEWWEVMGESVKLSHFTYLPKKTNA
ncbi:MAG: hypothetical protein ACE5IR_20245 [bacterium]